MKVFLYVLPLIAMILFSGCQKPVQPLDDSWSQDVLETSDNDTLSFKDEYEAFNNEKPFVFVPEDLNIHILDYSGMREFLEKGDGILYFWFPECPRCRVALPPLFTAMKNNQISDLYVYNPKPIRNQMHLDDEGVIVIDKETNPEYQYLLDHLGDRLPPYRGLGDPTIKRLHVPFVITLQKGKIIAHHYRTVDDQLDPNVPLTSEQETRLQNIYHKIFFPLVNAVCWPDTDGC